MIEKAPESIREALIEGVPIVIGRINAEGKLIETEGSIPRSVALGALIPGQTNLQELFPHHADEIREALDGGQATLVVQTADDHGIAHFEVPIIFDRRHGSGAYFLIHDVTETRQLQVALLDCTDREQMRVGQELHDTLGQELTGLAYRLHALRDQVAPAVFRSVDELQDRLSDCLKKARDIAFKLSPHLEGGEIIPAFERLSRSFRESFDVDCLFTSQLDHPITDTGVAFNLFRIAQEACTNAVRHAGARRIDIRLSTGPENLLEVSDDGHGLDRSKISDFPGTGIPTMKFRAHAIGGLLRLSPRDPTGTLVRCRFENKPSAEAHLPALDQPCETCS